MRNFAACFSSARSVKRRVSRLRFFARPCTARVLQVVRAMADFWRARWRWVNVCEQAGIDAKKQILKK